MKYQDALDTLKSEISGGRFSADRPLPGEHELARRFGIARETLRRALAELQREGLVVKRRGAGTFLTKLASRRSGLIGVLIPDYRASDFFVSLEKALGGLIRRQGYRIVLKTLEAATPRAKAAELRRKARELVVAPVEGVVFRPVLDEHCSAANREALGIFRHAETPVVLIDADVSDPPERSDCDLVAVNNVDAGRRIAEHLIARGRRKIGFMLSAPLFGTNTNHRNRLFGLAGEMAIRRCEDAIRSLDFRPTDVNAIRRLLRSRQRPDAIVCGDDESAACLIGTLTELGVRIPDDIAVVGFDDADCARQCVPPLTTVRQPLNLIAHTAFRTLLARIRQPNAPTREINLNAPLIVRQTT